MRNKFHSLPAKEILGFLSRFENFCLLESALCDIENFRSIISWGLLFKKFSYDSSSFITHVKWAETISKKGHFVLCILPYEAGIAIEPAFNYNEKLPYPAIFLVFKNNIIFDHKTGKFSGKIPLKTEKGFSFGWKMKELWFDTNLSEYSKNIKKIKNYIKQGETYQVNYTIRSKFQFSGSVYTMYLDLREMQKVPYSAFIKIDDQFILSFSPELFFRKTSSLIITRPMKGTIRRGQNPEEDENYKEKLRKSIKDRAENLMIVDMMRNDLGRICRYGSVITNPLFCIEKYRTLFQMTSTVSGILKPNMTLVDIFSALFPSASITGAPKIRTMQIIKEIEKSPRKIYTGTIGVVKPDGDCVFNVAIRTIMINGKKGEMGTGGGIVYDSKAKKEYKECQLKASFLISGCKKMKLIETIRWTSKEGYFLLDLHMKRLCKSAEFFHFICNRSNIIEQLKKITKNFKTDKIYRVRLLLSSDGTVSTSYQEIQPITDKNVMVAISKKKINPDNIFLFHKTTIRDVYNKAHLLAVKNGFFDIIFENSRGEITEGAITNIFIEKNGILYTPAVSSGLLPGVFREYLIKNGRATEKVITRDELIKADKIFVGNSVRGLIEVNLEIV
ncbi:MAG TPA: aminodeoxychorismate synthase component I [bacterium]|nr:aminodeoxychorismate synthase component I [bacterium]HOL35289.1 aminodeoxychorismate synthase component I [bacterium]HPP08830.1 aminodeoxychorismate synthase component I [bacterium]